jgi:hypothetical protein
MAGQEIEGGLSGISLWGLICYHLSRALASLSLASMQNLGSRDPHLTKLALDQASRSCKWTHVSKRMFYARSD